MNFISIHQVVYPIKPVWLLPLVSGHLVTRMIVSPRSHRGMQLWRNKPDRRLERSVVTGSCSFTCISWLLLLRLRYRNYNYYIINYRTGKLPKPRRSVRKKLTVVHLVKKFPNFLWILIFITSTVVAREGKWTKSKASRIQSAQSTSRRTSFLTSFMFMPNKLTPRSPCCLPTSFVLLRSKNFSEHFVLKKTSSLCFGK